MYFAPEWVLLGGILLKIIVSTPALLNNSVKSWLDFEP